MIKNIRRINLSKDVNIKTQNINRNVHKNKFMDLNHTINVKNLRQLKDYKKTFKEKKICIIFHIYYNDLINEILNRLKNLSFKFDLIIVSPKGSPFNISKKNEFSEYNPKYMTCVNVGKDIGGKLEAFKYLINENLDYDYLILAHDKKSPHVKDSVGIKWRNDLFDAIFSPSSIEYIMNAFIINDKIKMCGGRVREGLTDSRAIAVNRGNTHYIKYLLEKIFNIEHQKNGAFIGGTMFWVDWNYFKEIFKKINLDHLMNQLERGNVKEPSHTHAMERIFGLLVTYNKNKIGSI